MRLSNALSSVALISISMVTSAFAATTAAPTCKTGKPEENIAIAKNFYKATETGDAELMGRILADNYRSEPVAPGEPTGAKAAIERLKFTYATFAPMQIENVEFFTVGNKVIVRSNITATHSGPFVGLEPTGKTLKFGAIDIHTICDGKIILGHHEEGWMAVFFQLGVLPVKK